MWRSFVTQTRREKRGSIDGINLFFGALLGANLGSFSGLGLLDYTLLVVLLAGTVITIRIFTLSERRGYAVTLLLLYIVVAGAYLLVPPRGLEGLDPTDRHRLAITLLVWIGSILMVETVRIEEQMPQD
jgi:predicted membrane channel-forming protein YqfA (hemolysin III family)